MDSDYSYKLINSYGLTYSISSIGHTFLHDKSIHHQHDLGGHEHPDEQPKPDAGGTIVYADFNANDKLKTARIVVHEHSDGKLDHHHANLGSYAYPLWGDSHCHIRR